ncbi:MAG: Gfo/Idh/MocA family oxidoreductase [Clostridia bacterium]|nr:Gfo/Idh/MocA family oxidoreductase [Clostridia bacterium]
MDQIKVGVIGVGARGICYAAGLLCWRRDTVVTYVCDLYEDRCQFAVEDIQKKNGNTPKWTKNYKELIESPDVEVVIVTSSWDNHVPACVYAMKCGKPVATEVGGAYSIDDCWKLVNAYEKTGIHCMMLENCCYEDRELALLRMVREGMFGKIVHCEGGYQHDLRDEICEGEERRHYRLCNYQNRNCDNYPTHALGPISKMLDINRGNRMVKLISMASGAWGLNDYAKKHDNIPAELQTYRFKQGDIVKTMIQCAHGETICLTLDTSLVGHYTRNLTIRGTDGWFEENSNRLQFDNKPRKGGKYDSFEAYREEWRHPIREAFLNQTSPGYTFENDYKFAMHQGIDWLVLDAFFTSLHDNDVPPIDTYDCAAWMAISPLSEISIANGSMPVDIPDFTRGMWTHRTEKNTGFYALDK